MLSQQAHAVALQQAGVTPRCFSLDNSISTQARCTSPACGRGRAEGAGEGSLLWGLSLCGDTLSPTLSRKRERESTAFVAASRRDAFAVVNERRQLPGVRDDAHGHGFVAAADRDLLLRQRIVGKAGGAADFL
ncbi:hypothetical protein ABIB89_004268 [Bradyrhizobium sp. JR3.12]